MIKYKINIIEKYAWIISITTIAFYWLCIWILTFKAGMKPDLAYRMVPSYGMEWCQDIQLALHVIVSPGGILYILFSLIRFSFFNRVYYKQNYRYVFANIFSILLWYYWVVIFDGPQFRWFMYR